MPNGRYAQDQMVPVQLGAVRLNRNVEYNLQWNNLNELDRIARFVLAIAYSGYYAGNDTYNQAYVAARTVAVARSRGALYIAANTLWREADVDAVTDRVSDALRGEGIGGLPGDRIVFVFNPRGDDDREFHAEMQLVEYLHARNLPFDGNEIGVSKPCCTTCANRLDRLRISYSYWHNQGVGVWRDCGVHARWW